MAAKQTTVWPVEGHYLNDHPAVETTTETLAEAEALVATGAFTFDPPGKAKADNEENK
jgi:hypothetical protein